MDRGWESVDHNWHCQTSLSGRLRVERRRNVSYRQTWIGRAYVAEAELSTLALPLNAPARAGGGVHALLVLGCGCNLADGSRRGVATLQFAGRVVQIDPCWNFPSVLESRSTLLRSSIRSNKYDPGWNFPSVLLTLNCPYVGTLFPVGNLPSTTYPQLLTLNYLPSTTYPQLLTLNYLPSTTYPQLLTTYYTPSTRAGTFRRCYLPPSNLNPYPQLPLRKNLNPSPNPNPNPCLPLATYQFTACHLLLTIHFTSRPKKTSHFVLPLHTSPFI